MGLSKRILAIAVVILAIVLVSSITFLQSEINGLKSDNTPNPTPLPTATITPIPSPTVNCSSTPMPTIGVTSDLNVTYSSSDSDVILINGEPSLAILINGTVTNNGAKTAYKVGLAVSADTSMLNATPIILTHAINTTIPLVSGRYNANGQMLLTDGSTSSVPFSNLSPNQRVSVSIAVYAHVIHGLIDVRVNSVWSDTQ
jgi:hypothetical protein